MHTTGKTILITGGGTGIGLGLAHAFHDLGNTVIVAGRTQASLDAAIAGRAGMHTVVLDAADEDSVAAASEAMARDFPALNMLIHSAGIMSREELATGTLDLPLAAYLIETQKAVSVWSVAQGIIKSEVFAVAIALISCQQGFATTGGAEGVGQRTTSSVVTILFTLILIDAAFTVFFHYFNL